MNKKRLYRYIICFSVLIAGIILFFALNVCTGSVKISLGDCLASLTGRLNDSTTNTILWDIRLPRAVSVLILGGALALAGYLLQTFFHNPIAGPFVLGISSGAKMCVALAMVFLLSRSFKINSFTLIISAFAGAMISMGFVLLMTKRVHSMLERNVQLQHLAELHHWWPRQLRDEVLQL